jgi:hypothetical protein
MDMDLEKSPGPEETAVTVRFQQMKDHPHERGGIVTSSLYLVLLIKLISSCSHAGHRHTVGPPTSLQMPNWQASFILTILDKFQIGSVNPGIFSLEQEKYTRGQWRFKTTVFHLLTSNKGPSSLKGIFTRLHKISYGKYSSIFRKTQPSPGCSAMETSHAGNDEPFIWHWSRTNMEDRTDRNFPTVICARYCLLGLCYTGLPDIDAFQHVLLHVLITDVYSNIFLPFGTNQHSCMRGNSTNYSKFTESRGAGIMGWHYG